MSYRKRTKGSRSFNARMAAARAAKERKRLEGDAPDYPADLPMIRRRVIIEDYTTGQVVRHEFILAASIRIDSYDVSADGVALGRMGWARALVLVRKAFIRTGRFD